MWVAFNAYYVSLYGVLILNVFEKQGFIVIMILQIDFLGKLEMYVLYVFLNSNFLCVSIWIEKIAA